jgi:hypothetical protein
VPRGTFEIPIQLPQQQSSACLAKMNESVAWQCASNIIFQVNVGPLLDNSTTTTVTFDPSPESFNNASIRGQQPPNFRSVELKQITETELGPTYYFRTTYDRVVLLDEDELAPAQVSQPLLSAGREPFEPGDKLWRCIFNDTLFEGYLYPNQNTTAYSASNSTADPDVPSRLPKIPHMLKLIEQRVPDGKRPRCEKVRILADMSLEPIDEPTGVVSLAYTVTGAAATRVKSAKFRLRQQSQAANACRCQWMVQ